MTAGADDPTHGLSTEFPTMAGGAPGDWAGAGLPPGSFLGTRYEIQEVLGAGGMGAVYRAHDRELDRTVAIKVIRPDMASRPGVLERFKREILLASKVTHKNVLRIHDFGEAGPVKFISMNYVEGSSLNELLDREGPLPLDRALPLIRQMAEALQAAHEAGIVHRDLKPQNILIDRENNAFIADFGISRSMETGGTITETGALLGTIAYMSPEQARGERSDHRGDIYSFGVILFQMFTGSVPFSGGDTLSVLMKRVHEEPPPVRRVRPQVPGWMSDIIARTLRRDPADRYQSVAELLRDLDRHQASASWRRIRRRVVYPAVAALAVVAALVAGVQAWRARPPGPAAPKASLVILPFQNGTGDPRYDWARDGLPSLLRDELVQARELQLFGEDRVREVLGTLRAPEGEESRPATMRRIATLVGADTVLAGRLLKIADEKLRIEASIQRAGGEDASVRPIVVDGTGDQAIQSMLAELSPRLLDALGVSRGWLERARVATKPLTRSAEALALHGQGLALARSGKFLDASKRLEEAVQKDEGFFVARAHLAETYDALGYSEKALTEAKRAADGLGSASPYEAARIRAILARIEGDNEAAEKAYASLCEITPSDAEAFFDLAIVREERGNLQGALEALNRAVELDPKHPSVRFARGRVLSKTGKSTEAAQELNATLRLHEETNNQEAKALVLNGLGNIDLNVGDYENALKHFQAALDIRRSIGDQKGVRTSLTNVAVASQRMARFPEAIKAGEEAVAIARTIDDRTGLGNTLSELGDVYQMAGRPESAMPMYQESLRIFREKGTRDAGGEARALGNIGAANTALGRYVEALYSLKDALAKRREIGDKGEIIRSLSDIGDNERFQGGYEEALKYYSEGLSLARETDEQAYVMVFLSSLSSIHEDQGDYGAALSLIAEADKMARAAKDDAMLATLLTDAGGVRFRLGDLAGAQAALDEATPLVQKNRDDVRLMTEFSISRAALSLARGERDAAAASAREAVRLAKGVGEPWLTLRTRLTADEASGTVRDLELVAKDAESAGLVPVVSAARLALARAKLASGQKADAQREAELAAATAKRLGQRDILMQAQHIAGQALERQGEKGKAADRFAAGLGPLEEILRGLRDEPLKFFLARPETSEFGKNARELFVATNRASDKAKLDSLITP